MDVAVFRTATARRLGVVLLALTMLASRREEGVRWIFVSDHALVCAVLGIGVGVRRLLCLLREGIVLRPEMLLGLAQGLTAQVVADPTRVLVKCEVCS